MHQLTPIINTNFYGFDYYEVAYTSLTAQFPAAGGVNFPNVTFANPNGYTSQVSGATLNGAASPTNVGNQLLPNISSRDVIVINSNKIFNVMTNNMGIEFYTKSWKDAFSSCYYINNIHTYGTNINGSYSTAAQSQGARKIMADNWWYYLLSAGNTSLEDFNMMGLSHKVDTITDETKTNFITWMIDHNVCPQVYNKFLTTYASVGPNEIISTSLSSEIISVNGPAYGNEAKDYPLSVFPCPQPARPRFDFIKTYGRLILPPETYIDFQDIYELSASEIYSKGSLNFEIDVPLDYYTMAIKGRFVDGCYVPINDFVTRNWVSEVSIDNVYGISAKPSALYKDYFTLSFDIPPAFFNAVQSDPSILNQILKIKWKFRITENSSCIALKLIEAYYNSFYPRGNADVKIKYVYNCGIVFENAEGFADEAFKAIEEMKTSIREIFVNNYTCYARELSKTQEFGDIINITGRLYDAHGSECWMMLKQVLRPIIKLDNQVVEESLQGFDLNKQAVAPTIENNKLIPDATNDYIQSTQTKLSSVFKKNGNKLCPTLPSNLNYK